MIEVILTADDHPLKGLRLALTIPVDGTEQANYVLLDANGQTPVAAFGAPVWTIDNPAVFSVTPAADHLSGVVRLIAPDQAGAVNTLTVTTPTSVDGSTAPIVLTDTQTVGQPVTPPPGPPASLVGTLGPVTP